MTGSFRNSGDVVALRYLTTDGRIEMCWPCRVIEDREQWIALFISAGSAYRAGPKRTAAEKLSMARVELPPDEYVWRKDTLRLMFPGRQHSVWLSWVKTGSTRTFSGYFVNLEEPFRRTHVGFDTADHTLDIEVAPDLSCKWRDTEALNEHVSHRFYTTALASEVWEEGRRAIGEITRGSHPCLAGWCDWEPDPGWEIPHLPMEWSSVPPALWERHFRAYGRLGRLAAIDKPG